MNDILYSLSYSYLDCPNKNKLFDEKHFFSSFDELTICNKWSIPSVEKFIYDVFDFYWFRKFANQWNISEKLYQERLYPDFDDYEYGFSHCTHPSVAELSIYMRTLNMIQFAYVMAGYYIGLPRKFIKNYAMKEITVEQLRLLFHLIDNNNIPLSSIENLFADFSLKKANEILDIANKDEVLSIHISSLIESIKEIPIYEEKLYTNFTTKEFCDDYFKTQFFKTFSVVFIFYDFNVGNTYYPTEEKLKYYLNHLDFSQFAFVMLGYYYGLPQELIDNYGNENISYHSMEFLIEKLRGTCLSNQNICNFKRNNICFDKMNNLFNEYKDIINL